MKTLKELIADADAIKTQVADLQAELRDMEKANEQKQDIVDMARLMQSAAHAAISDHYLNTIKDAYTKEAYLTLLLSLANLNVSVRKKEDTPLLYPCRVAAALDQKPDMDLLLKKSMVLNEDSIDKIVNTLLQAKLQDLFILDCLMTTGMYDADNESKLEYIVGLGAMMAITKEALIELVAMAKAVITKSEFRSECRNISINQVLPILKLNTQRIVIHNDDTFIYYCDSLMDIGSDASLFEDIFKKSRVLVRNVSFNGLNNSINIDGVNEVSFQYCHFRNIKFENSRVIYISNVKRLTVSHCDFNNCCGMKWHTNIMGYTIPSAHIADLNNVVHIGLDNSSFVGCHMDYRWFEKLERAEGTLFNVVKSGIVDVQNCEIHDSVQLLRE